MQDKVSKPKPRMVRKQILITPEQSRRLALRAKEEGIPVAVIVRDAITRELGMSEEAGSDWKQRIMKFAGALDEPSLDETIRRNRTRWNDRLDRTRRSRREAK